MPSAASHHESQALLAAALGRTCGLHGARDDGGKLGSGGNPSPCQASEEDHGSGKEATQVRLLRLMVIAVGVAAMPR